MARIIVKDEQTKKDTLSCLQNFFWRIRLEKRWNNRNFEIVREEFRVIESHSNNERTRRNKLLQRSFEKKKKKQRDIESNSRWIFELQRSSISVKISGLRFFVIEMARMKDGRKAEKASGSFRESVWNRGRGTQKVNGEWKGKKKIVWVNRGAELYIRERSHLAICQADANLGGTSLRKLGENFVKSSLPYT